MSGAMARRKGATFERTVANMLTEATGTEWRRRVRNQGLDSDVVSDSPVFARFSIECKNAVTLCLPAWWRQTQEQAGESGIPMLIHKLSGSQGVRVMFDAHHVNPNYWPVLGRHTVTLDWDTALQWLREKLPPSISAPGII